MKKKILFILSLGVLLSIGSVTSCSSNTPNDENNNKEPSGGDEKPNPTPDPEPEPDPKPEPDPTPDPEPDPEPEPETPLSVLEKALKKDYSNLTANVYMQYENGEMSESFQEYYFDNYVFTYSSDMAESYGYENAFLEYYVEKENDIFESYLYFEKEAGNPNSKGGWLQEGYHNADLSIWNAYLYLPFLLNGFNADTLSYSEGLYYINDSKVVETLNRTAFGFAWYNEVIDVSFLINEAGYINKIIALCDENFEDPKNYIIIDLYNFNETAAPTGISKHDAPNETNKIRYYEYKGYEKDYEKAYYKSIDLKITENQEYEKDAASNPVINLDDRIELELVLDPTEFKEYQIVDEKNRQVTWHYDETMIELEAAYTSGHKIVHAMKSGETEIYATVEGENGTLESSHIKIIINEKSQIDSTGALYDLQVINIDSENHTARALNKTEESLDDYSISVGSGAKLVNGKYSDIFTESRNYLTIDPAASDVINSNYKPGIKFNFSEHEVNSLEFEYGLFYENHFGNLSNISSFTIVARNSKTKGEEIIDITDKVKNSLSKDFSKIMKVEFPSADEIEFKISATTIGKSIQITLDRFVFKK